MAFKIVSSLRMQATRATLAGFPIRIRRSYISLITLLYRLAESEAMYRALRTLARPPQIERLPRFLPLSQLKGATPTSEAIFLRSRCPNSGNSANRVVAVTGPTPGTERRRFSFSRHTTLLLSCLLYTSDAADDLLCVDLGGRRIIKKKK